MVWRFGLFIFAVAVSVYFLSNSLVKSTLTRTLSNQFQRSELAEISSIKGSVQLRRGQSGWRKLEASDIGFIFYHNDELQVGSKAALKLKSFGTEFNIAPSSFVRVLANSEDQADFVFRHGGYKVTKSNPKNYVSFIMSSVATDWLQDSTQRALDNLQTKMDHVIPLSPPRANINPLPVDEDSFSDVSPVEQIKKSLGSKNALFKRCAINLFRQSKRPPSSINLQFLVRTSGKTDDVVVNTKSELATQSFQTCIRSVVQRMQILNYDGPEMSLQFPLRFSAE